MSKVEFTPNSPYNLKDSFELLSNREQLENCFFSNLEKELNIPASKIFKLHIHSVDVNKISGCIEPIDCYKNILLKQFFLLNLKKNKKDSKKTDVHISLSNNSFDFTEKSKEQIIKTNQRFFKTGTIAALAVIAIMIPAGVVPLLVSDTLPDEIAKIETQLTTTEQLLATANLYKEIGETESAIRHYDNVLYLDPGNYHAHANKHMAFSALAGYEDVLRTYESAIIVDPNYVDAENDNKLQDQTKSQVIFYPKGIDDGPGALIPQEYDYDITNYPVLSHPQIDSLTPIVYPTNYTEYPTVMFSEKLDAAPMFVISENESQTIEGLEKNNSESNTTNQIFVTPKSFDVESESVELYVSDNHTVRIEYISGPDGPLVVYPYYFSAENPGPAMVFPEREFYPFVVVLSEESSHSSEGPDDKAVIYGDDGLVGGFDIVAYSNQEPGSAIDYQKIVLSEANEYQTFDELKESIDRSKPILLYPDDGKDTVPVEFPLGLDYVTILEPPITQCGSDIWYRNCEINTIGGTQASPDNSVTQPVGGTAGTQSPLGIPEKNGSAATSASSSSSGSSGGGSFENSCGAECIPPTLGITYYDPSKRMVDEGFSYNGYATDVDSFYTPFPLLGVSIGQQNVATLKIYDNQHAGKIQHVGIAFNLGEDQSFNESNVRIELDRKVGTAGGILDAAIAFDSFVLSIHDPQNILEDDDVYYATSMGKCKDDYSNEECLVVSIYHTFRAPLEHNRFATYVWDDSRNGWQNYFNHGIKPLGESMNPPLQHTGIFRGQVITVTETGEPNKAMDENGNTWTFDGSFWRMDYAPAGKIADGITMHGIDRNNVLFEEYKDDQIGVAEQTLQVMMDVTNGGKQITNESYLYDFQK